VPDNHYPDPQVLNEARLRRAVGIDDEALAAVESAFRWLEEGRVRMPPIMHIEVPDRGDVDVKSAFVEGLPYFAIKIASGFYGNRQHGLPTGSAMMVLLSADTGFCEAVLLDNSYLTDLRTALAGAVAAKYLAPDSVGTVGVLGTGVQARYQPRCLRLVRDFRKLVVWGRSPERQRQYADEMRASGEFDVTLAASAEEVVRSCDVLITATASRKPLVQANWLHTGQHVTAVGADFPGKQELDAEVLRKADRLVCDRLSQCRENGELQHLVRDGELPADLEVSELGELVTGGKAGRRSRSEITVCDLTGTGVQDTAIANLAFRNSMRRG
jgi:ectoine utilization protein EutC